MRLEDLLVGIACIESVMNNAWSSEGETILIKMGWNGVYKTSTLRYRTLTFKIQDPYL